MTHSAGEIGAKMSALGLWGIMEPYNFAVKPLGTVFPYFCTVIKGDRSPVAYRFLMLEGWQTLHDFVRTRCDVNFGFYSTPAEMPHFELVVLQGGETRLFRHDPGIVPHEATGQRLEIAAKVLWESYGVMLRVESDRGLPLKFADDRAVFARVEKSPGQWVDEPLVIPDPPPHVEKVTFAKADVKAAQDLPLVADDVLELDFALVPGLATKDVPPRSVYGLVAVDGRTGERVLDVQASIASGGTLRGLWENMPQQVLKGLVRRGRVPGEIKVRSGRLFRMMRPLCVELPFKLSLHDRLSWMP